jgi:hypothetical protein
MDPTDEADDRSRANFVNVSDQQTERRKESKHMYEFHNTPSSKYLRQTFKTLVAKPEGERELGDTSEDGRIILKWTLKN